MSDTITSGSSSMASGSEQPAPKRKHRSSVTSHFWVGSHPFFDSTLLVAPPFPNLISEDGETKIESVAIEPSQIQIYDPDGYVVNELTFLFPQSAPGVLELDQLMAECKMESGMKHGHMVVHSPYRTQHACRIHTREGGAFMGEPSVVNSKRSAFFPITFAEDRSSLLCVVNYGEELARLRCRLYCGSRTPEAIVAVPGMGSRVISIPAQFPEYGEIEPGKYLQAYVRLGTQGESRLGVQAIERTETKENGLFNAVG